MSDIAIRVEHLGKPYLEGTASWLVDSTNYFFSLK